MKIIFIILLFIFVSNLSFAQTIDSTKTIIDSVSNKDNIDNAVVTVEYLARKLEPGVIDWFKIIVTADSEPMFISTSYEYISTPNTAVGYSCTQAEFIHKLSSDTKFVYGASFTSETLGRFELRITVVFDDSVRIVVNEYFSVGCFLSRYN